MRSWAILGLLVVLASGAAFGGPDAKKAPANSPRFEALKKLVGDWVQVGDDGKPTGTIVSSIKLTAGGTAIQETEFPGQPHEMVTLYTVDGTDLILTHYCVLGNQPRMRAEPSKDVNQFAFKCIGGGNIKSESDEHMHQATITIVDANHYNAEWCACGDGKETHKASMKLARKQ